MLLKETLSWMIDYTWGDSSHSSSAHDMHFGSLWNMTHPVARFARNWASRPTQSPLCPRPFGRDQGGEGGIRTPGTARRYTAFRERPFQPLRHLSSTKGNFLISHGNKQTLHFFGGVAFFAGSLGFSPFSFFAPPSPLSPPTISTHTPSKNELYRLCPLLSSYLMNFFRTS